MACSQPEDESPAQIWTAGAMCCVALGVTERCPELLFFVQRLWNPPTPALIGIMFVEMSKNSCLKAETLHIGRDGNLRWALSSSTGDGPASGVVCMPPPSASTSKDAGFFFHNSCLHWVDSGHLCILFILIMHRNEL